MAEMMRPVARDDRGPYVTFTGARLRGLVLEGLNVGDEVEVTSTPDESAFGMSVAVVTSEGTEPLTPDGEEANEEPAAEDYEPDGMEEDHDHYDGDGVVDHYEEDAAPFDEDDEEEDDYTDPDDAPPYAVGEKVRPGDFAEGVPHRQLIHTRTAPLKVPLSEEAMHELEGELAEANIALLTVEDEAAAVAEVLKLKRALIKTLKAEVDELTRDRRAGTRETPVEMETWSAFDLTPPMRVIIRIDTMEIVALDPIKEEDRQTVVPLKAKAAPTLAETLGAPKEGPKLTVIVGGRPEWDGDEIPGDDDDVVEPEDVNGDNDEIPF